MERQVVHARNHGQDRAKQDARVAVSLELQRGVNGLVEYGEEHGEVLETLDCARREAVDDREVGPVVPEGPAVL